MLAYFEPLALAALRLFAALLTWMHAAHRLYGMFGEAEPAVILSPSWFAGNLELVGGIALGIGFLTRPVALIVSAHMMIVYLVNYLPKGFPPIGTSVGEQFVELSLVCAFIAFAGPGRFSVDSDLAANHPDIRVPDPMAGLDRYYPHALGAVRILMGVLFLQHGLGKLGIGDEAGAFLSQRWIGGVIEVFGGSAITFGLFTRPVAFLASGMASFAYFIGHASRAFAPIQNGGDRPALYCFFFLVLTTTGPGLWAVEQLWRGRTEPGVRASRRLREVRS